jgi:hypothetical protein
VVLEDRRAEEAHRLGGEPVGLAGRFEQRNQAVEIVQVANDPGVAFGKIVERSRLKVDVRRSHRVLLLFWRRIERSCALVEIAAYANRKAVV